MNQRSLEPGEGQSADDIPRERFCDKRDVCDR